MKVLLFEEQMYLSAKFFFQFLIIYDTTKLHKTGIIGTYIQDIYIAKFIFHFLSMRDATFL